MENIEKYIEQGAYIYIDTCSFMNEQFESFMENHASLLKKSNSKIIVLDTVLKELQDFSRSNEYLEKTYSTKALNKIYNNLDLFETFDTGAKEKFADPSILKILLERRRVKPQVLITNDHNLARDGNLFNAFKSFKGFPIKLYYFNSDKGLIEADWINEPEKEIQVIKEIEVKEIVKETSKQRKIASKFLYFGLGIAAMCAKPYVVKGIKSVAKNTKVLLKK